jgi:Lon protease-like protein
MPLVHLVSVACASAESIGLVVSAFLPLFPLNTVLYPDSLLPLYIFEKRYQLMMKRVLSENIPVGIVLIKRGEEVGGIAEPYDVGTSARVIASERLSSGYYKVVVKGSKRFRISGIDYSEPYLQAEVQWLNGDQEKRDASTELQLKEMVMPLFRKYMKVLEENYGVTPLREEIHTYPPAQYSYIVAEVIQVDLHEKQRLLEADCTSERLRMELELLERFDL